ncbi:MAG: 3-deoxy-manno-octulosonate cytidylyltransferase [Nitrospinales bacterium]
MPIERKIIVIIPARMGSTRFPGKPLAKILSKPMIQRVYEQAKKARLVSEVIVATDDKRIMKVVQGFGGNTVMTSSDHVAGTDRVAEAAGKLDCDIVVNVQGDEPLMPPENIDLVVRSLLDNPQARISTLMMPCASAEEILDPDNTKVVANCKGEALYFSRSPIPFFREGMQKVKQASTVKEADLDYSNWHIHIGIYAFTKTFLLEFTQLPESPLEKIEKLEQLRILQNGIPIKIITTDKKSIGVDHPSAIKEVEDILRNSES